MRDHACHHNPISFPTHSQQLIPTPVSLNAAVPLADVNEPILAQTSPTSNNPTSPLSRTSSPILAENPGGAAAPNATPEGKQEPTLKQNDGTEKGTSLSPFSADRFADTQNPPNLASPQSYSTEFSAFNPLLTSPTTLDPSSANFAYLASATDPNQAPPTQNLE